MVQANANLMAEIWERVQRLNAREKLSLASRLLQNLELDEPPQPSLPIRDPTKIIGVLKSASHLTDEDVDRIIVEEITRKHGG